MECVQQQQQQQSFHRLKRLNLMFAIPYHTEWGQCLVLSGSHPHLGSWDPTLALPLSPKHVRGHLFWIASLPLLPTDDLRCPFLYHYSVVDYNSRRILRSEAGSPHSLSLPADASDGSLIEIHDLWQVRKICKEKCLCIVARF